MFFFQLNFAAEMKPYRGAGVNNNCQFLAPSREVFLVLSREQWNGGEFPFREGVARSDGVVQRLGQGPC
jgi:hypothetical protein